MESTLLAALSTASAIPTARTAGPSLPSHFSGARHLHPLLLARSSPTVGRLGGFHASRHTLRSLGATGLSVRRLQCLSSSSPSFNGGGAGLGGFNGGRGGGGGGGSDSGDSKSKLGAGAGDGVSVPSSDIIILSVGVRSLS